MTIEAMLDAIETRFGRVRVCTYFSRVGILLDADNPVDTLHAFGFECVSETTHSIT